LAANGASARRASSALLARAVALGLAFDTCAVVGPAAPLFSRRKWAADTRITVTASVTKLIVKILLRFMISFLFPLNL
jgi:hypothetical protein